MNSSLTCCLTKGEEIIIMVAHSSVVNLKRRSKNPVGYVFQTSRQEPCWLYISSSSLAIWRRNSASNSGPRCVRSTHLTGDRNHKIICFRSVTKQPLRTPSVVKPSRLRTLRIDIGIATLKRKASWICSRSTYDA